MEYGSIEREFHVEAAPEVVFEVISSPEHVRQWWGPDEADLKPVPGAVGELVWGKATAQPHVAVLTVVDAEPPRLFSFRWVYDDAVATANNSLLVTFELVPASNGTVVRLTETGFREKGWQVAVLEAQYKEHCIGWDTHLPRLREYVTDLVSAR